MFSFSSIKDYHTQLKEGSTSCTETVEYYLRRIKENEHLNAFTEVYAEEALKRAKKLDEQRNSGKIIGKLHGVVVGLKDVIAYKDHPLTASSKILENFKSVYSATAVQKLIAEEAIIIGSLNCDEFAMGSTNENSFYGKVLNPLDNTRVPGGSSGGSAAAVSADLCMVALGSDTGGSVRQPADFCGIVGLKPTYGRISRHGLIAYASSFDQIGIFAINIPDAALMLEVIGGADDYDSTASSQPPPKEEEMRKITSPSAEIRYRIAFFPEALDHPSLEKEIAAAIKKFIGQLKNDDHDIKPIEFDLIDYVVPAYYILTTAEASSNLSRYEGVRYGHRTKKNISDLTEFYKQTRSEGFGKEVKRRIMLGTFVLSAGYYDAYFTKAQKVRKILHNKFQSVFNEVDFIILPTVPSTAFKIGEKTKDPLAMYIADIYTVLANLIGVPAISLPLFKHSDNMPFGVQILARSFNEVNLLRFSNQILQQYGRS